jgi:uracil-DNA glycosylase family 4
VGPRDADGLREGSRAGSLDARRRSNPAITRTSRANRSSVRPDDCWTRRSWRQGIDREAVFVTNVVKHFKWRPTPGSKRRLHERPNREEVGACLPWVESELALVRPEVLVLLGATAAQALLGDDVRVTRDHGKPIDSDLAPLVLVTIHPSAVLRARGQAARAASMAGLIGDLRVAAKHGG